MYVAQSVLLHYVSSPLQHGPGSECCTTVYILVNSYGGHESLPQSGHLHTLLLLDTLSPSAAIYNVYTNMTNAINNFRLYTYRGLFVWNIYNNQCVLNDGNKQKTSTNHKYMKFYDLSPVLTSL